MAHFLVVNLLSLPEHISPLRKRTSPYLLWCISWASSVSVQSTWCRSIVWLAHQEEKENFLAVGMVMFGAVSGSWCSAYISRWWSPFFLDNRGPLLLLFLSLAKLFVCFLAPPGQRGGNETWIPLICFFSSFAKVLMDGTLEILGNMRFRCVLLILVL